MKPKTRQEIAIELEISRTTLYRLLKEAGIKLPKGLLYARQQELIYKLLGSEKKRLEDMEGETT